MDDLIINIFGNWNYDTKYEFYSSKMPTRNMKTRSTHLDNKKNHFDPITTMIPPELLNNMLFTFIESGGKSLCDYFEQKHTANFFRFFKNGYNTTLQGDSVIIPQEKKVF